VAICRQHNKLDNVTLLDPVPEAELVEFPVGGQTFWVIPYRPEYCRRIGPKSTLQSAGDRGAPVIVARRNSHSEAGP